MATVALVACGSSTESTGSTSSSASGGSVSTGTSSGGTGQGGAGASTSSGGASCDGGGQPAGDVTGDWSATMGTQAFMQLAQDGVCVTGQSCESAGMDCYPIQNGRLVGDQLTFFYTFGTDQVDATLTLSGDGATLSGNLYSTKCSCDTPHTYVKQ